MNIARQAFSAQNERAYKRQVQKYTVQGLRGKDLRKKHERVRKIERKLEKATIVAGLASIITPHAMITNQARAKPTILAALTIGLLTLITLTGHKIVKRKRDALNTAILEVKKQK